MLMLKVSKLYFWQKKDNGWKKCIFPWQYKNKNKKQLQYNEMWVKVFSMSEGDTCIAEPNLEVTLNVDYKIDYLVLFCKMS